MKIFISLMAAFGILVLVTFIICAAAGTIHVECKWYQWVANGGFLAICSYLVYHCIE